MPTKTKLAPKAQKKPGSRRLYSTRIEAYVTPELYAAWTRACALRGLWSSEVIRGLAEAQLERWCEQEDAL